MCLCGCEKKRVCEFVSVLEELREESREEKGIGYKVEWCVCEV